MRTCGPGQELHQFPVGPVGIELLVSMEGLVQSALQAAVSAFYGQLFPVPKQASDREDTPLPLEECLAEEHLTRSTLTSTPAASSAYGMGMGMGVWLCLCRVCAAAVAVL